MHATDLQLNRFALVAALAMSSAFAAAQSVPSERIAQKPDKAQESQLLEMRENRSRGFVENKGQWDKKALFLGKSKGLDVWITKEGLRMDAYGITDVAVTGHVFGMRFLGGRPLAPKGISKKGMKTDFVRGEKAISGAATYEQVYSSDVYKGISLKNYYEGSKPRYDLIVAPGADPSRIKLGFSSVNSVAAAGNKLIIKTSVGDVVQSGLAAYQVVGGKRKMVPVAFRALGNKTFAFKLGKYDRTKKLIIDPVIYGSYYGGDSGMDEVHAVVADAVGGVYMTGSTKAPDFPIIYGPYSFVKKGEMDGFVSKLEGDVYKHDYAVYIGGFKNDSGDFLQIDQFGHIWVAGRTESNDFPGRVNAPNVQWLRLDPYASQGHRGGGSLAYLPLIDPLGWPESMIPNGDANYTLSLGTTTTAPIKWDAGAQTVQAALADVNIIATVTDPDGTGPVGPKGLRIELPASVVGELSVNSKFLQPIFFIQRETPSGGAGRAQLVHPFNAQSNPNSGEFRMALPYTRNGQNFVARTAFMPYNVSLPAFRTAMESIAKDPADPSGLPVIQGTVQVHTEAQENTGILPANGYVVLFPTAMKKMLVEPNPVNQINVPYVVDLPLIDNFVWDPQSSRPTGPDPGFLYTGVRPNPNGGAFNLRYAGKFTDRGIDVFSDPIFLHDRLGSISIPPTLGGGNSLVMANNPDFATLPDTSLAVIWLNELLGTAPPEPKVFLNQQFTGTPLGPLQPIPNMLSEARVSPTPVYTTETEDTIFVMRFKQDVNIELNPLPTKAYFFSGKYTAPDVRGFRIIPHDVPTAGEPVRMAFGGNIPNFADQAIPQIPGVPNNSCGFILRINFTDAAGFSVVPGATQYVRSNYPLAVNGIDVDAGGNVYVGGTVAGFFGEPDDTAQTGNFITTPVDPAGALREGRLLRYRDQFARKYSPTGSLTYSVLVGGDAFDTGNGIAVDLSGNAYLYGTSRSFNFPRTRGVFGEVFTQSYVLTVVKINPAATDLIYGTHLRTANDVYPLGIAVDPKGVAYVTGTVSRSTIFRRWGDDNDPNMVDGFRTTGSIPVSPAIEGVDKAFTNATAQNDFGGREGFVMGLNPSATGLVYASYLGSTLDDEVFLPYIDKFGDVWLCGYTDTFRAYFRPPKFSRKTFNKIQVKTGLPAGMVTSLAFRPVPDPNLGLGGSGTMFLAGHEYNTEFSADPWFWESFRDREGWVMRLRIGVTSVANVGFVSTTVPGGLGASSTGIVQLSQAAPVGGAEVALTMAANSPGSFSASGDVTFTKITIPAGQVQGTFTVFTKPVTDNTPLDVQATFQGNFKVGRLVVVPWLQSFSVTPDDVVGGNQVVGRVQVAGVVGAGGLRIDLSSDEPSIVNFTPPSVIVPPGQNAVSFPIDVSGVDEDTVVTINASLLGVGKKVAITVHPVQLKAMTFSPSVVTSGTATTGTLVATGKAGPQGFQASLQVQGSPAGYTVTPSTITFAPGESIKTFSVSTPYEDVAVPTVVVATLIPSAGYSSNSVNGTFTATSSAVSGITVTPDIVDGGATVQGVVTISAPALAGGAKVDIAVTPSNGTVTAPTKITIPVGTTTGTFQIKTTTLVAGATYTVKASRGSSVATDTFTVRPLTFTFTVPSVISGGSKVNAVVTMNGPAPAGGVAVKLTSSKPTIAAIPDTVVIPAGTASVNIPIQTTSVSSDQSVTFSAKIGTTTKTALSTVVAPKVVGLVLNPTYVLSLKTTLATVNLNGPAPAGGMVVTLTSSTPSVASVPTSVTVPAGKTSLSFTIATQRVTRTLATTITAKSANSGQAQAVLTVHN